MIRHTISGRARRSNVGLFGSLYSTAILFCPTANDYTLYISKKLCHSLEASLAAHLISRKVGVSIDAQEGYIYFALCSILATVQIAKNRLLQALVYSKIGFVIYFQVLNC